MMTIHNSQKFSNSGTVAVSGTSASFLFPSELTTPATVRFVSDVNTHVAWSRAAVLTDAFVPANCVEYLSMGPNDTLNVISASGAPTGTAWFTIAG